MPSSCVVFLMALLYLCLSPAIIAQESEYAERNHKVCTSPNPHL